MTLRLSNSEMKTFRRCKRKWWLSHYRELAPKKEDDAGSALSIGNAVHDALAAYYEDGSDPVAHVVAAHEAWIERDPAQEAEILKQRALVQIMVEGYLEWLAETAADADLKILGSERYIQVPIVEGIDLLTKLDAPVERGFDGAKLALEHKTTDSLEAPVQLAKLDTQYLTEHLARFLELQLKGAEPEEALRECQGVLVNALRKVKRTARATPPFYARYDVTHNVHELRSHWLHVLAIAREIQQTTARLDAEEDHHTACPPNPTRDCKWDCPFFQMCVMLDDGSNAEGALSDLYQHKDPLERYQDAEVLA